MDLKKSNLIPIDLKNTQPQEITEVSESTKDQNPLVLIIQMLCQTLSGGTLITAKNLRLMLLVLVLIGAIIRLTECTIQELSSGGTNHTALTN